MTWTDFTEKEVSALPKDAGVYALAISEHASRWVYVGQSGSLRTRVMYHFYGKSAQANRILPYGPKRVGYEKVNGGVAARLAREAQLTKERHPYFLDHCLERWIPPSLYKVRWAQEESLASVKSLKKNSVLLQTPFLRKLSCIFTAFFVAFFAE